MGTFIVPPHQENDSHIIYILSVLFILINERHINIQNENVIVSQLYSSQNKETLAALLTLFGKETLFQWGKFPILTNSQTAECLVNSLFH